MREILKDALRSAPSSLGGWLKRRSLKFYLLSAALAAGFILLAFGYAGEACRRLLAQKEDQKLERVGDQAGREADKAVDRADDASVERRVNEGEYNRRATLRERADRDAESARARLREAERRYADDKKNFRPSSGPLAVRLDRAISDARAALAEPDPVTGVGREGDGGGRPAGGDDRGAAPDPRTP